MISKICENKYQRFSKGLSIIVRLPVKMKKSYGFETQCIMNHKSLMAFYTILIIFITWISIIKCAKDEKLVVNLPKSFDVKKEEFKRPIILLITQPFLNQGKLGSWFL